MPLGTTAIKTAGIINGPFTNNSVGIVCRKKSLFIPSFPGQVNSSRQSKDTKNILEHSRTSISQRVSGFLSKHVTWHEHFSVLNTLCTNMKFKGGEQGFSFSFHLSKVLGLIFSQELGCQCRIWLLPGLVHCFSAIYIKLKFCDCRNKELRSTFSYHRKGRRKELRQLLLLRGAILPVSHMLGRGYPSLRNNSFAPYLNASFYTISQCFATGKRSTVASHPQIRSSAVTTLPIPSTVPDYCDIQVIQCSYLIVLIFPNGLKMGAIFPITEKWGKANSLPSRKKKTPTEITRQFTKDGQKGEVKLKTMEAKTKEKSGTHPGPRMDPVGPQQDLYCLQGAHWQRVPLLFLWQTDLLITLAPKHSWP